MTVGVYLQNLVSFQLQAGMVKGALESSKRSLEICERYFEPDSLTRMSSARARGMALIAARRTSESLSPLTDAHEAAARIYGPSDRITLSVRAMRALALAHTGAVAEARGDIQAVLDEAVRENVVPVFVPLRYSGLLERLEGNFVAALDLQERALEVAVESPGTARRALTLLEIGMLRVELGNFDTAIVPLEEAGERLSEDGFEPNDAEILIGLGRARLGQGRPSEALPLLEEADRFWRDFDPENRWAGEASLWLSDCYAVLGRRRASEEARKRAVDILSGAPDPAAARLLRMARRPAGS
jgi:tetratricopeptide (TPR) repeat protein